MAEFTPKNDTERNLYEALEKSWIEATTAQEGLESVYAHIRALVANEPGDMRHALVGLLPECAPLDRDMVDRMLKKGMVDQVKRLEGCRRDAWAEYGYPEAGEADRG